MQPFELAEQICGPELSDQTERFESEELAQLIDNSEGIWRQLNQLEYAANEHGHVEFNILNWENHFHNDDHVDAIETVFVDPAGRRIKLGHVMRVQKKQHVGVARAYAHASDIRGVPIAPDDERWEAIVDVLQSAIGDCQTLERAAVRD